MKKGNLVFGLLCLAFISITIFISSCGEDESCLTCTLAGQTDEVCESDIDQFNRDSGLNAGSLGEVVTLIQLAGGSCR